MTPTRRGRSPLIGVFLTVFIDLLGFGIIIPLLPVYSKAYGAGEITLGLLFGSYSGMQVLFAPYWGSLSDRIGRRPVLILGLLGTSVAYLLFAFADSMPALFLTRALAGFFGANVSTAQAYIADVTTPEGRARGMGILGAAFGLGFTFGPLFGGELSRLSIHAPGFAAAGLSLVAAAVGWAVLVEPESRIHRPRAGVRQVLSALGSPAIGRVYLLSFLAMFAFSAFETMFTRYGLARYPSVFGFAGGLDDAGMREILDAAPIAGRYLFGIGIVSAIVQGALVGRLVKRFGEARLVVAGPALLGASFLVIAAAPLVPLDEGTRWWIALSGCFLMPFGFGINNPSLSSLVSRRSAVGKQGSALGMLQSIASLARLLAPPCAGAAFTILGPEAPFAIGAAILFAAALLARGIAKSHPHPPRPDSAP